MLTLYYKPTCAFSSRVISEAEALGIKMNLKDISTDDVLQKELEEKGGKVQTPYLVDDEQGVAMYESGDIVEYLATNYGSGAVSSHAVEECESCQ